MEQRDENLRVRLLSHLPQPENIAAYREEVASLLAKHEKALFWDRAIFLVLTFSALIILVVANAIWGPKLFQAGKLGLLVGTGFLYFVGMFEGLRYHIYRNKVDVLKEVKQVQLQVLELQASLRKDGGDRS